MKRLLLSLVVMVGLTVGAEAAARFAVCSTTCTWDNSSTAMWSTSSGGATGASAPTSADDVTLDAATCVGGTTCTITTFAGTISVNSITMSACTASTTGCVLDASANNTNFTIAGSYVSSGTGTRTLNMGGGTWTMSSNTALWNSQTVTNFTLNAGTSTLAFTGTGGGAASRRFITGTGKSYSTVSAASGTNPFVMTTSGTTNISTLTISPGNTVTITSAGTFAVTTITNVVGSSSAQTLFTADAPTNGRGALTSANNWSCTWCGFSGMAFSGGGSFTATNSFDFLNNTGITPSPPTGGTTTITVGGYGFR